MKSVVNFIPYGSMVAFNYTETSQLSSETDFETLLDSDDEIYRVIVDRMEQGVLVYDGTRVLGANSRLSEILECPPELVTPGASLEAYIQFGASRGDYADSVGLTLQSMRMHIAAGKDYIVERRLPNGRTIRIDCRNNGGFGVGTYTDVTVAHERELLLQEKEQEVRKLSETDGLTGLANRRSLDNMLNQKFELHCKKFNCNFLAVILIDLDRFKCINDTYGHGYGDALLQELSKRFTSLVSETGLMSRIGGDEFAAVVEAATKSEIEEIAANLCDATYRVVDVEGTKLKVESSIGLAFLSDEMKDSDELLTAADLALYEAKRTAKGTVCSYEPLLREKANKRFAIEQDLQFALKNDEFVLYYQVQRDLKTNEDVGYEALMRWQHPERGLVSPADFITIAEETGAIVDMGRWALHQAATDIMEFDSTSRVSVNVSPAQFVKSNIAQDVRQVLSKTGLPPSRLEIEITETLLIEDTDNTLKALNELREIGISISLDDFGTGYSSLAYLTQFPFTKLKIDRSFIDGMMEDGPSRALIDSILVLASSLNLKVTAEGVETQEQLDILKKSNCDEAQGYLLGKPRVLET